MNTQQAFLWWSHIQTIVAKSLGTLWYFPIQKCIRGTKHLTVDPSPPPPPKQCWLREAKMLPVDFNIGWGRGGGGIGERKIFFRVFAFLRWWHYLVWMCSVPRTFGQDCLSIGMSDRRELPFWCRFHHTFMQEILFLGSQEGLQLQGTEVLGGGTVIFFVFLGWGKGNP